MGQDSKKRGRPLKIDARRNRINVRLSNKELGRVREIGEHYDICVNEVLRMALEYYYENVF